MKTSRGDTIIEVMLAFSLFSLTVVGSIMLMNKGMATAQRSLELTLVRQQIDSQLTMLDNLKQTNPASWKTLTQAATTAQPPALGTYTTCPTSANLSSSNAFFLAANATKTDVTPYTLSATQFQPAKTYAMVDTFNAFTAGAPAPVSYGVWVMLVRSENFTTSHAYDVHIRACWYSVGDKQPTVIATVMRMYDAS